MITAVESWRLLSMAASLTTGHVHGITTDEHTTQARRPAYSVLSNFRLKQAFASELPDWSCQLRAVFAEGRMTKS
jgi:dTDP-4-dehydrorhamnose reductase